MKAGVELDLLIAEHIMGWQWQDVPRHIHLVGSDAIREDEKVLLPPNAVFPPADMAQGRLFYHVAVPAYSTNLDSAWQVVKYLKEKTYRFTLEGYENFTAGFKWESFLGAEFLYITAKGETPMHAICLAALKVKGVDYETEQGTTENTTQG